jgi:hypothetical protein
MTFTLVRIHLLMCQFTFKYLMLLLQYP